MSETHWYRCEVVHYATVNEHGDVDGRYSYVKIMEFKVLRHTPKGVWLKWAFNGKFVLRDPKHRARVFAAPTEEQAKKDFIARKGFEIRMLHKRLYRATTDRDLVAKSWPDLNFSP